MWGNLFDRTRRGITHLFPEPAYVRRLEQLGVDALCARTTPAQPTKYPWVHAIFSYNDPRIRRLIWEVKYRANPNLLATCGVLLADEITGECEEETLTPPQTPILTPIPLTPSRMRERTWNQSALLIEHTLPHLPERYTRHANLLKRRDTPPQTKQTSHSARRKNVAHTFSITKNGGRIVPGADIILIDDVSTTGATLKDARRTLKKAGARSVTAFVVGH